MAVYYKCPNGEKLALRASRVMNLGACPYCKGEWVRMTAAEVEALEAKRPQEKVVAH